MGRTSIHRWFKRCLEQAGLSDRPMHELRHSAGDAIWRATGNIVLAQQLLRDESVGTTQRYLHPTREDLADGLRSVGDVWREGK
jgi:integrase